MPELSDITTGKMESLASEAAVLGSMIIDPACIPHVLAIITRTNMFFRPEHHIIFDAIVTLHLRNAPVEAVLLRNQLESTNQLDEVGGVEYIARILDSVVSSANCEYYANIVRERALYRKMVTAIEQIKGVTREPGTVNEQIEMLHQLALGIQQEREDEAHTFEGEIGHAVLELIDDKTRIPTDFVAIDRIIRGIKPGHMIVVAGRPSMGKTSLAMDITRNLAVKGKRSLVFSLEMPKGELMQRAACSIAEVNTALWPIKADPPIEDARKLIKAATELEPYPITIYDTVFGIQKIRSLIDIQKRTAGVDLVVIDYLQLMTSHPPLPKEYERISLISGMIKRTAVEVDVPIMLLSQLSREVEKRSNKRPMLSDLRGSGNIEQDADMVLFLYRADVYQRRKNPDTPVDELKDAGMAEVIVAKNRGGRTGTAKLVFREEFTKFRDLPGVYPDFQEME